MEKQAMKQHIDETVEALRPELLEISQYIFQLRKLRIPSTKRVPSRWNI